MAFQTQVKPELQPSVTNTFSIQLFIKYFKYKSKCLQLISSELAGYDVVSVPLF